MVCPLINASLIDNNSVSSSIAYRQKDRQLDCLYGISVNILNNGEISNAQSINVQIRTNTRGLPTSILPFSFLRSVFSISKASVSCASLYIMLKIIRNVSCLFLSISSNPHLNPTIEHGSSRVATDPQTPPTNIFVSQSTYWTGILWHSPTHSCNILRILSGHWAIELRRRNVDINSSDSQLCSFGSSQLHNFLSL